MALTAEGLISNPPRLHGVADDGNAREWGLRPEALRTLSGTLQPGWHTLETGAGVSTVLFAIKRTHHTCVVPSPEEIARIQEFCADNGVSTDLITFVPENSETALPRLDPHPLDLVLIDGSHSFPSVFIDWYYSASRLRRGGWLLIDDTHLWTSRVLRDVLRTDDAWELVEDFPFRTAIFKKCADGFKIRNWVHQPYVVSRSVFTQRQRVLTILRERDWRLLGKKLRGRLMRASGSE